MNAARKKDREQIARNFIAIAERCGAKVERRDAGPNPGYRGASVGLRFTLNEVGASVSVDNLHGGGEALIHWHNDYSERGPARDFSPAFNCVVGDLTQPRPHHKATSGGSWARLEMMLLGGLSHAAAGTAFLKDDGE